MRASRERITVRGAEIRALLWIQTEKTTPWRSVDLVFAPGVPRSRWIVSTQLLMKTGPLCNTKNRAGSYVDVGERFLRRALNARSTICMKAFCGLFRRLLTTHVGKSTEMNLMDSWPQKKTAPSPDGIPYCLYKCAGGLGSQFLFKA